MPSSYYPWLPCIHLRDTWPQITLRRLWVMFEHVGHVRKDSTCQDRVFTDVHTRVPEVRWRFMNRSSPVKDNCTKSAGFTRKWSWYPLDDSRDLVVFHLFVVWPRHVSTVGCYCDIHHICCFTHQCNEVWFSYTEGSRYIGYPDNCTTSFFYISYDGVQHRIMPGAAHTMCADATLVKCGTMWPQSCSLPHTWLVQLYVPSFQRR